MKTVRAIALSAAGASLLLFATPAFAQIVINEIVKEERTAGAGGVTPDNREYVELYNAGAAAVDVSGWTLSTYRLSGTTSALPGTYFFTDTINPGTIIQPGEYFVLGNGTNVPEVDQDLGSGLELFEDLRATVMELRSGPVSSAPIIDAVGYDRLFAHNAPPVGVTFVQPTPEQAAQIGNGVWGQVQSYNITETGDFKRLSLSRYRDGRDTNRSGRDFGYLPMTPGASNNTLPENNAHVVPDVSALNPGDPVTAYNYAFIPARAIDVTQIGPAGIDGAPINPSAIAPPPTGGNKAIVMWDETGGGNTSYSKEYVNKFDIYAYLDANPINLPGDWEAEWSAYGIGTVDPLFGSPNPSGFVLGTSSANTNTQNGSTGIGWLYTRFQERPAEGSDFFARLQLVDFGEGGNSVPSAANVEWDVIEEFDLVTADTGWHHLGIDYDPDTGEVVATFGDQTFEFTTETDLLGTFYSGYRVAITDVPGPNVGVARPPTFVQFPAAPPGLPGDFNEDDKVDAADYVVWSKNGSNPLPNDGGAADSATRFALWKASFGNMQMPGGGSGGAVPEPGAMILIVMGVGALAARRRSRR
jgi:hypothetical protein